MATGGLGLGNIQNKGKGKRKRVKDRQPSDNARGNMRWGTTAKGASIKREGDETQRREYAL